MTESGYYMPIGRHFIGEFCLAYPWDHNLNDATPTVTKRIRQCQESAIGVGKQQ